jgi:tellurite resistance protein
MLLLTQVEDPETIQLTFGMLFGALAAVLIGAVLAVWLVRAIGRLAGSLLRRVLPERITASPTAERRALSGLTLLVSLGLAARTGSAPDLAAQGAAAQVGLSLLATLAGLVVFGPLVFLLSPSYRAELGVRFARIAALFGLRLRSLAGWVVVALAVTLVAVTGPVVLLVVLLPASVSYLRGRAGADEHPAADERVPTGPRPTVLDRARRITDRLRTVAEVTARRAGSPGRADQREAVRAARPKGPREDPGEALRRWLRGGIPDRRSGPPREPKFRTRSGGDGTTTLTARRRTIDEDGRTVQVVEVDIDAAFRVPRAGSPVVTVFELFDVTASDRRPTAVHRWGRDVLHTAGPYRVESPFQVPAASTRFTATRVVQLPGLHAPYRGDRTIRAVFRIHRPRTPHEPVAQGWVEFPYREEVPGYVEAPRIRLQTEAGIVTAGYAAVIADGDAGADELELLERFITRRHEGSDPDGSLAAAARAALTQARMRVQSGTGARELLEEAARDLTDSDEAPRRTAYELAVRIMAVDGRITEDELARLNELADMLRLDAPTAAALRQRHTQLGMYEGEDVDPLGVPDGTPDEQRRYLRDELRKWRSVATNPDPHLQQQAREMMERITERIAAIDAEAAAGTAGPAGSTG